MNEQDKTRQQLVEELTEMRQRVAALEASQSEWRRAQKTLAESEQRFRKVFDEGPLGVLLVGTDGRIRRCNRRFCEMLGYAESEIVALGLTSISHPDDWRRDRPQVSRLWRGEIAYYNVEKRYIRKDGQAIWGQLTVSLLRDEAGRPTDTIGMVEDVTERKRAEDRLRESERMLRTVVDASPESICLLAADETILLANATMAQRFGTTVDKIVGRKPPDLLPAEVAANRAKYFHEVVRTGKAIRYDDQRFERHMENAVHPIVDCAGQGDQRGGSRHRPDRAAPRRRGLAEGPGRAGAAGRGPHRRAGEGQRRAR